MPTYEYRCPEGHEFERFYRKISDAAPQVECPECGKVAERKMSAGAGLLFKGSGFYLTDYGKNAHRGGPPTKPESGGESSSKEAAAPSADSGSSAKSESKSDAKPATPAPKTESKPAPTTKPKTDK
jgi:putative FmdB family regulatory protein